MEWTKVRIGDLCNTISDTYHGDDPEVILVNTSDVLEGQVLNHELVKNEKLKGQFKKTFLQNDILYSEIRPANKRFAFIDFEDTSLYIASTKLMVLRPNTSLVLPRYLFAILKSQSVIDELQHLAESRSGTFPQITFSSELAPMEVFLPDIETQEKIVSVIDSFERKIILNKRINASIERLAKATFDSWFVDFNVFDEDFKDSPIGISIPESLNLVQIADIEHDLETGKRPKGGATANGIPSIGAESVKGLGNVNLSSTKYIPAEFAQKLKKGKINGYELMIYKDGGKPGEFHPHFSMFGEGYPFENCYINEHVFKLDFHDVGYNEFAYFYFQTDYVIHWLESNGGKAAIPGINQEVVNQIWIYHYDHPVVRRFCEWVKPFITEILKNCRENMKLVELRDLIVPDLLSGNLDVSEL